MPNAKSKPSPTRRPLRFEPPTLEEAIFAAQGLADNVDGQTEIAAMLMGLPEAEVRTAVLKAAAAARASRQLSPSPRSGSARPVVVVERRALRAVMR